jgi:integrase
MINRLTALKVRELSKRGRYADGGGLYLQVSEWGTKAWLFRYMLNGRARQMGLGSVNTFSLAEARERARQARQHLADDADPIDARNSRRMQAKAEAATQVTFKEAAEKYIAAHAPAWKSAIHAKQWATTLETYVFPTLGELSVAAIETPHILKVLEPIWTLKSETASRVRGRMEVVLNWATARGFRQGENPARWRGHLDHLLPATSKLSKAEHFAALPYGHVPAFVARLQDMESVSARALEFTIHTASRTGEVIGAKWSEIDLSTKVWTIPAERMKARREHRVPLSDLSMAILAALPRQEGNEHVFIGRPGKGLRPSDMLELVRKIDADTTVHGFRSSFRDWAGNQTNYPREIAEAALAHRVGDATEAAYRRSDALEKRRKLMQAWASYCERPTPSGQVTPMRRRAQ